MEKEIDKQLREFADSQRAPDDFIDTGVALCEKVKVKLQEEVSKGRKDYSIASVHYAGSIGQHIDVIAPDFDLVFKINNRQPPFIDVVNFFEEKLKEHSKELEILHGSIQQTKLKHGVQFTFLNGMKVDLLPATGDLKLPQIRKKLKRIKKKKNYSTSSRYWILFSTSFVDEQIKFMKVQSGFAHRVARLAKCWFKSLHFPSTVKITGGSIIFVLLGVEAAMHMEEVGGEPMFQAFSRVVDNVMKINKLQLAFKKDIRGNWLVMSGRDLLPDGHGQVSGDHGKNFIIEPSIPANNILANMRAETKKQFQMCAAIMKYRLQKLKLGQLEMDMEHLFEPIFIQNLTNVPVNAVAYVIEAWPKKKFQLKPGILIKNKNVTPMQHQIADLVKNQLVTTVASITPIVGNNPTTKMQKRDRYNAMIDASKELIKANCPEVFVNIDLMKFLKMKHFDVVVSVPYLSADNKCIMVGFAWSPEALSVVDKECFY